MKERTCRKRDRGNLFVPLARVFPTGTRPVPGLGALEGGHGTRGSWGRRGRPLPAAPHPRAPPSPLSPPLRPAPSARSQWESAGRGPRGTRANESAGPRGGAWPGAHHAGAVGADYFFRGRGGLSPPGLPPPSPPLRAGPRRCHKMFDGCLLPLVFPCLLLWGLDAGTGSATLPWLPAPASPSPAALTPWPAGPVGRAVGAGPGRQRAGADRRACTGSPAWRRSQSAG